MNRGQGIYIAGHRHNDDVSRLSKAVKTLSLTRPNFKSNNGRLIRERLRIIMEASEREEREEETVDPHKIAMPAGYPTLDKWLCKSN